MRRSTLAVLTGIALLIGGCTGSRTSRSQFVDPQFATRVAPPQRSTLPAVSPVQDRLSVPAGWLPPGGITSRWTDIIIHHSATATGGARAFDQHHRVDNGWDELGYHFVIGNGTDSADGAIEVGPRWIKQKHGAHCKTQDNYYNDHGIGICLVGDFTQGSPSPAQLASLVKLLCFLTSECGIPAERVCGHGGVTHRTACPGHKFPLAAVRQQILQAGVLSKR